MKAIIYTEYGSPEVLGSKEVEKPQPQRNEILVKVHATTVNYGDVIARNFKNVSPKEFNMPTLFWLPARLDFGFSKPKRPVLGSEFAGTVEAVGIGVKQFKEGDSVFGYLGQKMGAYAEYLVVPEDGIVTTMPKNMTFAEAASISYGATMALNLLKKLDIQPGQKILINGASGNIGSAAVQLAKHFGAQVTAVCSTRNLQWVKSLGADTLIDYTQEDFTQAKDTYDIVFDVLGRSSFAQVKNVLKRNGRYFLVSFKTKQLLQMMWTSLFGKQKVICGLAPESQEGLVTIRELVEAGEFTTVIDQCYPLEEAAEAHRFVEGSRHKGKVVVTIVENNTGAR